MITTPRSSVLAALRAQESGALALVPVSAAAESAFRLCVSRHSAASSHPGPSRGSLTKRYDLDSGHPPEILHVIRQHGLAGFDGMCGDHRVVDPNTDVSRDLKRSVDGVARQRFVDDGRRCQHFLETAVCFDRAYEALQLVKDFRNNDWIDQ